MWVRCQIPGPRESQFGLGMAFFGTPRTCLGVPRAIHGPTWVSESSIFGQKRPFLESRRQLSSVFWAFFELGTSLAEPDPSQNWPEPESGRRENTPCHRIDELFKPNWPPRPSQRPQRGPPPRTPQDPPRTPRVWD